MINLNIKIREAMPSDALEIDSVIYQTRLESYPNKKEGITVSDIKNRFENDKWKLDSKEENKKTFIAYVAKESGKIIGACSVIKEKDKNILKSIHVLSKYQGNGIGRKLWDTAFSFLDKEKDTEVTVASYNHLAIRFYEKLGFEDSGERYRGENRRMKSGAIMEGMKMTLKADI